MGRYMPSDSRGGPAFSGAVEVCFVGVTEAHGGGVTGVCGAGGGVAGAGGGPPVPWW